MAMAMQKWQSYYLGDNSYGRPIVGTEENINSFTQQMLFDHKADLYSKDNLIIVVAGKITNKEAIIKQLDQEFSNIPSSKKLNKPTFIQTLPTEHIAFHEQKNEQAHLVISAPGFDGNDETRYAANVLGTIL
jgi:predicted Zn-dependent peptidase